MLDDVDDYIEETNCDKEINGRYRFIEEERPIFIDTTHLDVQK